MSAGRFGWLWVLGSVLLEMVPNIIYNSPKKELSLLDSSWESLRSSFSLSCDLGHTKIAGLIPKWTCAFQRNSPWNLDNPFDLNWVWILQQRILPGQGFFWSTFVILLWDFTGHRYWSTPQIPWHYWVPELLEHWSLENMLWYPAEGNLPLPEFMREALQW